MFSIKSLSHFDQWLARLPDADFVQRDNQVIVLLTGGTKRTQKSDIKRAKALAALLD